MVRFQTVTRKPWLRRLVAIAFPMMPRPRNPTSISVFSSSSSQLPHSRRRKRCSCARPLVQPVRSSLSPDNPRILYTVLYCSLFLSHPFVHGSFDGQDPCVRLRIAGNATRAITHLSSHPAGPSSRMSMMLEPMKKWAYPSWMLSRPISVYLFFLSLSICLCSPRIRLRRLAPVMNAWNNGAFIVSVHLFLSTFKFIAFDLAAPCFSLLRVGVQTATLLLLQPRPRE
jgi:hypothetical protein